MNKKYFKPLLIIIALIIVCITTIVSYAYFVASVSSNASANVITTGNMEVTYENGQYNAYYHSNDQYISIQECEEDANHYSYSNHICQLSGGYESLDVCSSSSKGKPRCEMLAK